MLDLVRRCYPSGDGQMAPSHVVIEEVAPGTGWFASSRYADVLALGMWPSKGLALHGYEIKASRADLKRELADPGKHRALARYCDTWTLVAWDESVLLDGIPPEWGIYLTVDDVDGERDIRTHRKATKLTPEPWPKEFVCSLVRNASMQAPGAAYVARAVATAHDRARHSALAEGRAEVERELRALAFALFGEDRYKWPDAAHDYKKLIGLAAARLGGLPSLTAEAV